MADVLSSNVYALLDDENEDPQQLVKAAAKAAPPPKAADAPKPVANANTKNGTLHCNAIRSGDREISSRHATFSPNFSSHSRREV